MPATLSYTVGRFVWRELFTKDVSAAKNFYFAMFGWTAEDVPMGPGFTYTIWKKGDKRVGGMMDIGHLPADKADIPTHWAVYVSVPDVDAAAAMAVAEGGSIMSQCQDIPGVGRFAVVQDPQGAFLNLFRSATGDGPEVMPTVGEFCWENLTTTDPAAAIAFYQKVVGWGTEPMGPDTTILTTPWNGKPTGLATVGLSPDGNSHWGTFVQVEHVTPALAKCVELGGKVLVERQEIPNTGAFGILEDPTGAVLFLFESHAA